MNSFQDIITKLLTFLIGSWDTRYPSYRQYLIDSPLKNRSNRIPEGSKSSQPLVNLTFSKSGKEESIQRDRPKKRRLRAQKTGLIS